jgi:hypothetical protein
MPQGFSGMSRARKLAVLAAALALVLLTPFVFGFVMLLIYPLA